MMNENNEQSQLKVWISKTLHKQFKITCTNNETNMTQVIGDLITAFLREKGELK